MRTFSIYTLGCKVNHYESAQIRQFLENNGLSGVRPGDKPDLFVINTCCVTATASAKSRQYIQRAAKLNPKAVKIVCGCLAAIQSPLDSPASQKGQAGELHTPTDSATHLITNRTELADKIRQILEPKDQPVSGLVNLTSLPTLPLLTNFKEQTRAFLKVQDGCDGTCSYCIIPKVRPDVQSKPVEDVITEAKALVAAGHKEIVVTGVNLGAYGRETARRTSQIADCRLPIVDLATEKKRFLATENTEGTENKKLSIADLLKEMAEIEGLRRIRVSSLEPGDISEQLLDVFCAHKNIMPHIHLSVQSGSDRILRRMCRPHSAPELREKIALIKSRLDRPAITCDMIVGFPGETDEDFEESAELAKWAGFSKIHVFPFSARAGTAAAKMKEKIQPKVVKMRAEILRKLGEELGFKFREQFIGDTCEVLIEDAETASGHCERYFIVKVNSATKTPRHEEAIATEDFSHRGHRDHRELNKKQILDNLVPLCLSVRQAHRPEQSRRSGKGEIVRVKITAVTGDGAEAEAANSKI